MGQHYEMPHMGGNTISTKLFARLVHELREGEFSKVDRLPSELELAEHFGVSRSVIRDVLSNLEREGFVERGRGIGTIVHRSIVKLKNRLDLKYEYNQLIVAAGAQPGTDHVHLCEKSADANLARRLEIEEGETVIVCEKRLLANGAPVIYSIDHLPKRLFGKLDYRQISWDTPIFDILEEKLGIVVDTDIASIKAVNGSPEIREKLKLPQQEALMLIDEVGYYKLSRPILQTYGYYTNFFDFTMLRKKV